MQRRRNWIPPPCHTRRRNEIRNTSSSKQANSILEVIAQEISKLEKIVTSLDLALRDQSSVAPEHKFGRVTNLRRVLKPDHGSRVISSLGPPHVNRLSLLESFLCCTTNLNSSLDPIPGAPSHDKETLQKEELRPCEIIGFESEDINLLRKNLKYRKVKCKELSSSLKSSKRELKEKECVIMKLTKQCSELSEMLKDVSNRKTELESRFQHRRNSNCEKRECSTEELSKLKLVKSILEDQMLKDKNEISQLREIITQMSRDKSYGSDHQSPDIELQDKVKKLENIEIEYKKKLKHLERKIKKSQKTILLLSANNNGTSNSGFPPQDEEISLLKETLESKNQELQNAKKEIEHLKTIHSSETALLQNHLTKALQSESCLQTQLLHLKKSYALVFSDPSMLDGSSSILADSKEMSA